MLKVVGKIRYTGEYKGNNYDTTHLHCLETFPEKTESEGFAVSTIKVKASVCRYDCIKIGDMVDPYYDRYKNVVQLDIKRVHEEGGEQE